MGENSTDIQTKKADTNPDYPISSYRTFKQAPILTHPSQARRDSPFPKQGRSERTAETYSCPYVASCERRENDAGNLFQPAGNKKSPRPEKDLEDCTRFFILARSPALERTMIICLGRSYGLWFALLPVPSHLRSD
jgi:hypothetical protein